MYKRKKKLETQTNRQLQKCSSLILFRTCHDCLGLFRSNLAVADGQFIRMGPTNGNGVWVNLRRDHTLKKRQHTLRTAELDYTIFADR